MILTTNQLISVTIPVSQETCCYCSTWAWVTCDYGSSPEARMACPCQNWDRTGPGPDCTGAAPSGTSYPDHGLKIEWTSLTGLSTGNDRLNCLNVFQCVICNLMARLIWLYVKEHSYALSHHILSNK